MKKIMFIDDNRDLLAATLEALELHGFHAIGAYNAKDALDLIKTQKPDLILCDIMMPDMNGYDVINFLKSDPVTSLIPFIFLTAQADKTDLRKGMEEGADDYLIKPIDLETLLRSINSRLQKAEEIDKMIQIKLDKLRANIIQVLPHEMLTPLNVILGFSKILLEDIHGLSKSEIKELVSFIDESGNRLHHLVDNFINYASVSLNNVTKYNANKIYNIKKIIEEVTYTLASKYDRINDLVIKIEEAPLEIELEDFEFLIRELVDNAFKFSERNTNVIVTNSIINGIMEFVILDHGMGFPIEDMSDIGAFNQFNRKKLEQQGSGLGLITSMLIAQRYKGSILIKNDNFGSSVYLKLPIENQS